ncbi:type II secretion system F family protein [Pseudodesulfovibrio tunisiensis]|uniref:type II secretion system F family protein n=1 Tax=Pseudodesulfovibrio tunisiensis TaxID=463192 RepID=UPI001FB4FF64|nr:type II secretion system F family protein [Pseudodesulfovibrio tunisiensis]
MNQTLLIPMVAAGMAFVSVLLLGYGVMAWLGNASASARLRERVTGTPSGAGRALAMPFMSLWRALARVFVRVGSRVQPTDEAEVSRTRTALVQAGFRSPDAPRVYQGAKGCLAIGLAGLFLLLRSLLFSDLSLSLTVFLTVLMATLGVYGPVLWLRWMVSRRKLTASDELPDALDLLVVCVESGMGLDQAIDRVCDELRISAPVISGELKLLTLELRAGKARADALRALADRVGLEDLNNLTSLLVQADMFGISVGRTLRVYSDSMRTKRSQRAEEKAAKLPVLLLLPLIGFILPALFIAIMGPAGILFVDIFAKINK